MQNIASNTLAVLILVASLGAGINAMAIETTFESPEVAASGTEKSELPTMTSSEIAPANIRKGNVAVGGDLGASYSTLGGSTVYLNPSAEYFIADRVSVGGTLTSTLSENYKSYGIGPSATYYFWNQGQWAASTGLAIRYSNSSSEYDRNSSYWTGVARLGAGYFATPSVSFGPQLTIYRDIGDGDASASTWSTLLFQFNVYL